MRKIYQLLFLIILIPFIADAQWHDVTHLTGTQTIASAGIQVTVTKINNPGAGTVALCAPFLNYPYNIGNNQANGYSYAFSTAAKQVRIRIAELNANERVKLTVNGNPYPVTNADLTTFTGACTPTVPTTTAGEITTSATNAEGQIILKPAGGVTSFAIEHVNGLTSGIFYDVAFTLDTPVVFKYPFDKTMLCAGQKFDIEYITNAVFAGANSFTIELSNAAGSFSAGTSNIGFKANASTSGTITCTIPATAISGTNYRIRIKSTAPVYTTYLNASIQIDRFSLPPYATSDKDSFCEGEVLHLKTKYYTPGISVKWTGPAGFSDTAANPDHNGLQVEDSGKYFFEASIGACKARDTLNISVFINPPLQDVTNNGPLCELDTLRIILEDDTTGLLPITYQWYGPNGFSDTSKNPVIEGVTADYSGQFKIFSKLGFCVSYSWTNVDIRPKPKVPQPSNNGPIYPGTELRLDGYSPTPDVTYLWSGPDSFTSNEPKPTIQFTPTSASGVYHLTVSLGICTTYAFTVVDVIKPDRTILDMYPNPVTATTMNITGITLDEQVMSYVIVNLNGNIVHEGKIPTKRKLVNDVIDVPGFLANGQYYLKIKADKDFIVYPFIILR